MEGNIKPMFPDENEFGLISYHINLANTEALVVAYGVPVEAFRGCSCKLQLPQAFFGICHLHGIVQAHWFQIDKDAFICSAVLSRFYKMLFTGYVILGHIGEREVLVHNCIFTSMQFWLQNLH